MVEVLELTVMHGRGKPLDPESSTLFQVVIESSGFLLSIRGEPVTKYQVVLLVVYPKDTASFKDDLILRASCSRDGTCLDPTAAPSGLGRWRAVRAWVASPLPISRRITAGSRPELNLGPRHGRTIL